MSGVVLAFPGVADGPDDGHGTFEEYLISIGLHWKTRSTYLRAVHNLSNAATEMSFPLATASAIQVARLIDQKSTGKNSQTGQWRSALKHFWEWQDRRDPPLRAIRVPPQPRMVCKALEHDEARLLAATARGWWSAGTIVLVGLLLALRREEISLMRWEGFDDALETYTVFGKGSKTATLPVHPALRGELIGHQVESGWLFPGNGAYPAWRRGDIDWPGQWSLSINPATVSLRVATVYTAAGLRVRPSHVLRHTSLTEALDNTSNLRSVMQFARHSKPDHTAGYTRTTMAQLRSVVDALDFF